MGCDIFTFQNFDLFFTIQNQLYKILYRQICIGLFHYKNRGPKFPRFGSSNQNGEMRRLPSTRSEVGSKMKVVICGYTLHSEFARIFDVGVLLFKGNVCSFYWNFPPSVEQKRQTVDIFWWHHPFYSISLTVAA